ncbi:hypothetical protein MMC24_007281 [Lignoscripta atroalba]|nr:hypothetical protein [Lignoscripta atroalba]
MSIAPVAVRSIRQCLRRVPGSIQRSQHRCIAFASPRQHEHTNQLPCRSRTAPGSSNHTSHRLFPRARRRFSASAIAAHGHLTPPKAGEELHITFIDKEGDEHTFEVAKGDNLLDIAQSEDLEMEGKLPLSLVAFPRAAIESQDLYDAMAEPDDDENDMLDLAFGLTETSRLGCQVKMAPELDGLRVKLPSMTRNLQASDFSGGKDKKG